MNAWLLLAALAWPAAAQEPADRGREIVRIYKLVQGAAPTAEQISWAEGCLNSGGTYDDLYFLISARTRFGFKHAALEKMNPTVVRLYLDYMDREPDPRAAEAAAEALKEQVQRPLTPVKKLRAALAASPEFQRATVPRIYAEILRRAPKYAELKAAVTAATNGDSVNHLRSELRHSEECAAKPSCRRRGREEPPAAAPDVTPWPANQAAIFSADNAFAFANEGCETISYGTAPKLGDLMIGRVLNDSVKGDCPDKPGGDWSLSLVRMDWAKRRVESLYRVFDTSGTLAIEGGRYRVTSADDAAVAEFAGDTWVAFECAVSGLPGRAAASSCAGPLRYDAATKRYAVDPARTTLLVRGQSYIPGDRWSYSAGAPQIFVHAGRLYLYWTMLQVDDARAFAGDGAGGDAATRRDRSTTRGAELEVVHGRLRVRRYAAAMAANDPNGSEELLGLDEDRFHVNAEIFQVLSNEGRLIATGAGDGGRLFFATFDNPLGRQAMNRGLRPAAGLPVEPVSYFRFVRRKSDGRAVLMGGEFKEQPGKTSRFSGPMFFPWPVPLFDDAAR